MRPKELKLWSTGVAHLLDLPAGHARLSGLSHWIRQICPVDHFVLFVYERRPASSCKPEKQTTTSYEG